MRRAALAALMAVALVLPAGSVLAGDPGVPPGTLARAAWSDAYTPDLAIDGDVETWWNNPGATGALTLTFPERMTLTGVTLLTEQSGLSSCIRLIYVPSEDDYLYVGGSDGVTQTRQLITINWAPVETDTLVIDTSCASTWVAYREVRVFGPLHYDFTGFSAPVDNDMQNVAKAGSAIPVKFSLAGDQGLDIFAEGYPKAVPVGCEPGEVLDAIEIYAASGSGLQYDPVADQYTYVWKTQKAWRGCYDFQMKLADGSVHIAGFQFK